MKILKKGGVVEKRGMRKRNPCPMRLWVCLLNKCEISNSYRRVMTRFGIRQCEKKIVFINSDLIFVMLNKPPNL